MKQQITFLIFTILLGMAYGRGGCSDKYSQNEATTFDRSCPERPVQKDFSVEKYVSKPWYSLMRYHAKFIPGDCECEFSKLSLQADKSIEVTNCCRQVNTDEETHCAMGKAVSSYPENEPLEGKFNVTFGGHKKNKPNYMVLSTDYENYSIVYNCKNKDEKSKETFWLLSRTPELNPEVKTAVYEIVDKYFDRSIMKTVDHSSEKCENPDKF